MLPFDFQTFSTPINLLIFGIAAVVVWVAGTRISFYADVIADRTGMGKAFMGLLFLALATEVPEIGTSVSASIAGNSRLAVNNLFGGVIMQTTILAVVDFALIRGALTFFTPRAVLLLQGVQLALLLALALAAIAVGDSMILGGVGVWSVALMIAYIATLLVSRSYEGQEQWNAASAPDEKEVEDALIYPDNHERDHHNWGTGRLVIFFLIGTAFIFAAGVTLADVSDALAEQTGLGASFIGATLLAASTSLPELSTTIAAVRLRSYNMAISNIFGSNSLAILLIFVADVFYQGDPILNEVDTPAIFIAAMGVVVTLIYLIGLIERRNRTILRMGIDSALVLAFYIFSLVVLYGLR